MQKKLYLFFILFFFHITLSAQIKWLETDTGERLPIPPDGVWLRDNLFIDALEIGNIHWLEYLHYIKKDSSEAFVNRMELFMDSLTWGDFPKEHIYLHEFAFSGKPKDSINSENQLPWLIAPYTASYHTYPEWRYFPVVGVSYQQAVAYSRWRSEAVSNHWNESLELDGEDIRIYTHFRLPTEEEWEFAAHAKYPSDSSAYGLETEWVKYDKKQIRFLQKHLPDSNRTIDWETAVHPSFICNYPITAPDSGLPVYIENINMLYGSTIPIPQNKQSQKTKVLDIRHQIGNVAEMVAEQGIAKGGSWRHSFEECQIKNRQTYNCPTEWLGFRNVCEVFVYHKDSLPPPVANIINSEVHCSWELDREKKRLKKLQIEHKAKQKQLAQDSARQRQEFIAYIQNYHRHLTWLDSPIFIPTDSLIKIPITKESEIELVYHELDLSTISNEFIIDSINVCTMTWGILKDKPTQDFYGLRPYSSDIIRFQDNQTSVKGLAFQKRKFPFVLLIQLNGRENGEEVEKYIYQFWD